jgi:hypothetical protein
MIEPLPDASPEHRLDDPPDSGRPRPMPGVRRLAVLESAEVTRLPFPASSIIGRERETETLLDLFRTGHARLVTLTGPGGVGKSRLAIHVARLLEDEFLDGVVFVPLAVAAAPTTDVGTSAVTSSVNFTANHSSC